MRQDPELYWLPEMQGDWRVRLKALADMPPTAATWTEAVALSRYRLNFTQTNALGAIVREKFSSIPPDLQTRPERLAILSSATTDHLIEGLRVAALRRGVWMIVGSGEYGMYRQDIAGAGSFLQEFRPTAILLCLDAQHLTQGVRECRTQADLTSYLDRVSSTLTDLWATGRSRFGCEIFQQSVIPVFPSTFGSNEHRNPASRQNAVHRLNERLRDMTGGAGHATLISLDSCIVNDGLAAWHSGPLWNKSKQEITLTATPMFGEMVARVIGAKQGLSAKCCVVDLDNTLWGGVVGDDGEAGIIVGQGTAVGEAFVAMQEYLLELRQRGIILAVCSKNDEATARLPFMTNPDMRLKDSDFACFVANWDDKATNLQRIAQDLNIGLDALAFVDDNPVERDWVRRQLPMVRVPELPVDPQSYPRCLAESGYFEGVTLTSEDLARANQYDASRRLRESKSSNSMDLEQYLLELDMELVWGRVSAANLIRVTQLINKTNQFNLTTTRFSESEVRGLSQNSQHLCLQFRLLDRFGDNGLIAVIIGDLEPDRSLLLNTWLMSCRVLGRHVEEATLNVVAEAARSMGAESLRGVYRRTNKNSMVCDHYQRLGFETHTEIEGTRLSVLDLAKFKPIRVPIRITEDKRD